MSAPNPNVRLTRDAEQDYDDILLYTQRTWGARQRTIYRAAIVRARRRLSGNPLAGKPRDDVFLGCRALPVEQHVIYYFLPSPDEIVVVRILHHRQDPAGKVFP